MLEDTSFWEGARLVWSLLNLFLAWIAWGRIRDGLGLWADEPRQRVLRRRKMLILADVSACGAFGIHALIGTFTPDVPMPLVTIIGNLAILWVMTVLGAIMYLFPVWWGESEEIVGGRWPRQKP